jgi:hypothetical protein
MSEMLNDPFIGIKISGEWELVEKVGVGKIGAVYKAVKQNPYDVLACKIIPHTPKSGWDVELAKVTKLRGVDSVVQYHSHGAALDKNSRPYVWILWNNFIDGINLATYITEKPWPLDMAFIENIASVVLNVLYACQHENIIHGDLHAGNILISNPDMKTVDKQRKVWVSDFGYGGSHNQKKPKDDFKQLSSIIINLLNKLNLSDLNKRDRIMHEKLYFFFDKKFAERDPTQGNQVGNLELLIKDFRRLSKDAREEAEMTERTIVTDPGDYLWAEAIGNKAEVWKDLFVPEFLAARDLLNRNITILTGARGCGKTMAFRRLTAYMDKIVGEPSGVPGSDEFIGFYLNCRNLIEAFPWIPGQLNKNASAQIIHFFHLSWLSEICNTLYLCYHAEDLKFDWLDSFILKYFQNYQTLPEGADHLSHIMSFIESEKELCRLTELGKRKDLDWPLYKMEFLDELCSLVSRNSPWETTKPFYLFLDDYTIPIIPRAVQIVLNPIVFKRRDTLFFKVSTESFISFERTTVRGKPLELHQDFELIDLSNESLHRNFGEKKTLLESIFKPRIDRHATLKKYDKSLSDLLGKSNLSNNELARLLRDNKTASKKKKVLYHGIESFVGMWSSDIRVMIQMFVDMIRDSTVDINNGVWQIKSEVQNNIYRSKGGEFLVFAESVPAPSSIENNILTKRNTTFGSHLIKIVQAFINVSSFELSNGELVSNEGRLNPKQAYRIEIIDKFELKDDIKDYYEGLVRWHIFLHDFRGKSVRGMITPRLFLNKILIPNSNLTFSSHDNIHLNNIEFRMLLKEPDKFIEYWRSKRLRRSKSKSSNQGSFFKNNE